MNKLILMPLFLFTIVSFNVQIAWPDLSKSDDLKSLGIGKIVEKDKSQITNITLFEVKEFWIVYVKNESIHDITMESIDRIEFKNSKWGPLKIEFPGNKPVISKLNY